MTDLTGALKGAINVFVWFVGIRFTVFGLDFSVASVLIFVGLVQIVLWFLHKLDI